jgi:adenylate kinase
MYVLIGPPCSGKSTLGDALSKEIGLPHVMASSLLKVIDSNQTANDLDALQVDVIMSRLREPDCAEGFVLDNFPRTAAQANLLEEALQMNFHRGISCVFDIEAPVKILESRAGNRFVNSTTGLPVTAESTTWDALAQEHPSIGMEAKHTQDVAVRRSDDAPERFQHRLERYGKNIAGLRRFYGPERCRALAGTLSRLEILAETLIYLKQTVSSATPMVAEALRIEAIFEPGKIGVQYMPSTGVVLKVNKGSVAERSGIYEGMKFVSIDGEPYTAELFRKKSTGEKNYKVTFVEGTGTHSPNANMTPLANGNTAAQAHIDRCAHSRPAGQITIETLAGKQCIVNLNGVSNVAELKAVIEKSMSIPVSEQRLVCGLEEIADSDAVPQDGASVVLVRQQANETEYDEARNILDTVEELLQKGYSEMRSFEAELNSQANWVSTSHRQPCGCITVTKRYVGTDLCIATGNDICSQIVTKVDKCREELHRIRRQHVHEYNQKAQARFDHETQHMSAFAKFFKAIFFSCENCAPEDVEASTLEAQCKRVLTQAFSLRSERTSKTMKAATQVQKTVCAECKRQAEEAALAAQAVEPGSP